MSLPQPRPLFVLFMLVTVLLCAVACWGKDPAEKALPLRVGMELSYPPFEMTDERGKPTGISVDLARDLGAYLGRETIIVNMTFDGLIPALKTGKIDLIISSMTATSERGRSIDFSEPYLQTGLCLLIGKDSDVRKSSDLNRPGKIVAVKKGTTGHLWATTTLQHAKVLVLDKEAAAVLEVAQGKADAFIYDQMSVYRNWQRNKGTTRALLDPFQKESWAIGIRKRDDGLKTQVNGFLREYRAGGGFDRLGNRYLKGMKDEFSRLGYPFIF